MEETKEELQPKKKPIGGNDNFNPEKRKNRVTMKERKFLTILSQTCSKAEAYRAVYKFTPNENKKLEAASINSAADKVLKRLKEKAPELVAAVTFENLNPEFVTKAMIDLYSRAKEKSDMNIEARAIDMMAKTQNVYQETKHIETKITDIVGKIYKETDEDMPVRDERIGLKEFNDRYLKKDDIPKV